MYDFNFFVNFYDIKNNPKIFLLEVVDIFIHKLLQNLLQMKLLKIQKQ